jgi:hypothetical protein
MTLKRCLFIVFLAGLLLAAPSLQAQGHFEFSGHYGRWSLNLLGKLAKDTVNDMLKDELEDRILEDIQDSYPGFSLTSYDQSLDFSSGGDNFGLAFRFYPGGHHGSFSVGASIEKCSFRVSPSVTSLMQLQDSGTLATATFNGTASGEARIKALAFLLTLRWDLFPSMVVHPYITFGGGISTAKALDDSSVSYSYTGQLTGSTIPTETVEGSDTKTLRELKDEAETDFPLPNFLPFLQLNLGLKARLTSNIHLFVDGGVLNGLIIRGGVALRL